MKIAIIGGAGFIGSHLATAYLDAGHDVLIIDTLLYGSENSIDARARLYQTDIRDEKLHTILQMERPDVVSYHVAQRETPAVLADADIHVRGLLNVLAACVSASVSKFIFASNGNSLYGYVPAEQLPLVEDTPLGLHHTGDITRIAGEWYVRYYTLQHGLTHTILRYADVYGEKDIDAVQHPISYFIRTLSEQHRPIIRGTGNELRDHLFIDDVVQANMRAIQQGRNQTLHISSGRGYTLNQVYAIVARAMKSKLEPVYLAHTHTTETHAILSNARAHAVLNWSPTIDLFDGVELAVARLCKQEPQTIQEESAVLSSMAMLARV